MPRRPNVIRTYRDAFAQRDLVYELDGLAAAAWPALTVLDLDGWRLRTTRGYTRRANSVWPRAFGDRLALDRKIDSVERHYRARGLAPTFQLSPAAAPAGLDRTLAERGYRPSGPTQVRTVRLEDLTGIAGPGSGAVTLAGEPTSRWLAAWKRASLPPPDDELAERLLRRVPGASAYAMLSVGGVDFAVARGVLDGGWLGIASVATELPHRRRGAGRALVSALVAWAAPRGAERAWVAVESTNAAGTGFWRALGLRTAYTYHYRACSSP